MLQLLAALIGIVSFVCWIFVLIDMFKDSLVVGILGLICGFYAMYYAIFEFDHDKKGLIVTGFVGGTLFAALLEYFSLGSTPL